jgi:glycosyltransferase involved in cell wall biosynthesis
VAVVIPVFGVGALLDRTLASVKGQTRPPDEIIVVDDGSADEETLAALRRAGESGVTVLRQQNQGPGAARNAGIRASRSGCIVPLDGDDILSPSFLEEASAAWFRAGERSIVTALVSWFVSEPGAPHGAWFPWGMDRDVLPYRNVASTVTALIPRALLEELGGYDPELEAYEDWDLYCRLALAGVEVRVLPRFSFHYRQRPGSRTRVSALAAHERLVATMLARYPELPERPDRTLRLFLSEAAGLSRALRNTEEHPPLRYRIADAANAALKKIPVLHGGAKRLFRRPGR